MGFAYTPAWLNSKTVVRGGFAMAYNRLNDVLFDPAIENGPGIFNFGLCCATDAASKISSGIQYNLGTSNAPNSYPMNPALKTAINSKGLPSNGTTVEAYGASPNLKTPYSYLYSLEVQQDLGHQLVMGIGYQGSTGRHYTRLVNQNFLYDTTNDPFYALYIAQSDSNQYYNSLNVHGSKHYKNGISLDATYSWSKSMDQVTGGDGANGSANQTYPYDNRRELGPSDFDVRHRLTASGTYDLHLYNGGNELIRLAANGWEFNGIFTAHTGFPFTPVTYAINGTPLASNANTIGPIRPNSYSGIYGSTCDASAFRNGTTVHAGDFGITPDGKGNLPAIGRNSFRGPCYQQLDAGIAKDFTSKKLGEGRGIRIQVQAFNVFNKLNYTPFGFASDATVIERATFGKPVSASAGRVVELSGRLRF